jgi:hypothetical protein
MVLLNDICLACGYDFIVVVLVMELDIDFLPHLCFRLFPSSQFFYLSLSSIPGCYIQEIGKLTTFTMDGICCLARRVEFGRELRGSPNAG